MSWNSNIMDWILITSLVFCLKLYLRPQSKYSFAVWGGEKYGSAQNPLQTLRDFNKKFKWSKIFYKLDLRSAFFHLPIHEDSISKTCDRDCLLFCLNMSLKYFLGDCTRIRSSSWYAPDFFLVECFPKIFSGWMNQS